ncbi:MAG: L-histidine N(alpha)-methyltransferase [Ignavibacteria bacterium]|nr:L-histidine N(alpha)-methyltransferase [Ignavibacteria bacterium]
MSKTTDLIFNEEIINERLRVYKPNNSLHIDSFADDVKTGLTSQNKFLLPKYFYDEKGSEYFERICETEEYYPTRTEISILKNLSDTISERNPGTNLIIELGSGSSFKTNYLLRSFLKSRRSLTYVPIDVSNILIESSRILTENYSGLSVKGVISFYEDGMDFIVSKDKATKLVLFLGSSIGNFSEEERIEFMKMLKKYMNNSDRLLIGFDLIKSKKILEDAYNDRKGFTAKFNLNIIQRINNELDGKFDLTKFRHSSVFNEEKNRIEMYLTAIEKMDVEIKGIGTSISFDKGEKIHTENSYKFNYKIINKLAEDSGMEFSDYYTDENEYFSICAFKLKAGE